ncbi:MAG: methylmalonyl-CoA epimerase [Anaerolineales bacterium]|nr:methylmalonyl-CoA epimerase [Anaerolineales bacterium]
MTEQIKIHHIAVAVDDLDAALAFWRDALGLAVGGVEDVPEQEAQVAFLPVGDSHVELVKPTSGDSGMARFIQKRGPGIHHLCLEVVDIDAVLESLKAKNIHLINETPLMRENGRRYAFIHPKSTGGVLIELYE